MMKKYNTVKRHILLSLLWSVLLLIFIPSLSAAEIQEHITKAAEAAKTDPDRALELLNIALVEHPGSGEVIIFRGMIYYEKKNDYLKSQKDFYDGVILLADNPEKEKYLELIDELTTSFSNHEVFDYFNRSYSLIEMGDYERAVALLHKSVKLQDNNARLYYELAYAYVELDDYENAVKNIEVSNRLNPVSLNILDEMKFVYVKTGNIPKLKTTINDIEQIYGKDPTLQIDLAQGYSIAKDNENMIAVLLNTIREYPEYSYSYFTLGEYYFNNGRKSEAVPYLNTYIEKTTVSEEMDSQTRSDINKTIRRAKKMIQEATIKDQ